MARRLKSQNSLGQYTKGVSVLITKHMRDLADNVDIRVKTLVRDKLEETYRDNVRATYAPVSKHRSKCCKL